MNPYKILLVDDEPDVLMLLEHLFSNEGYTVYVAESGHDALELFTNHEIDLVISDYKMPGMDGLTLLEKILTENPDVITILLTAYADVNVAINAINQINLYKYKLKPWDNTDMILTVKRALESRRLLLENRRLTAEIRQKEKYIKEIEEQHPGITSLETDEDGCIILDEDS